MYTIYNKMPLTARASIVRLFNRKSKKCKHIFSVFEILEPDMQEMNADPVFYCTSAPEAEGDEKVYYTESNITIDKDFFDDPLANFKIPDHKGQNDIFNFFNSSFADLPKGNSGYLLTENESGSDLAIVAPNSSTPTWIKCFVDNHRKTEKFLDSHPKLLKQVSEVSLSKMKFDLKVYNEHIGNIYFVWHHEYIRSIAFHGLSTPAYGVLLDLDFRSRTRRPLKISLTQMEQSNCVAYEQISEIHMPGFKQVLNLKVCPSETIVRVYDSSDELIYYNHIAAMLHAISVRISAPSRRVGGIMIEMPDGSMVNTPAVQKHQSEYMTVGDVIDNGDRYFTEARKRRKHLQMEAAKDFIFYNGNPAEKVANRLKAIKDVKEILNISTRVCYICDDYFTATDFADFIYPLADEDVEIRIINGKEELSKSKGALLRLSNAIMRYNKAMGKDIVKARTITGSGGVMHDRFIVADDDVWAVGASFNELGKRASVIYRIPDPVGRIIIEQIEEWWNTQTFTQDIHDVAKSQSVI